MNNYKSFAELKEELGSNYDFKLYEMGISTLKEVEKLQQENNKLNGSIQTYDILLKANAEENKILKENAENNDKVVDKVNWENQLLKKQNKQLKDNWNNLKEYIDIKLYNMEYLQKLCGCRLDDEIHIILDIIKKEMKELEGSDSNE